jgi:hypothetical protein
MTVAIISGGANIRDVSAKQGQAASDAPDTTSDTSTIADTISIAAFCSKGPEADDAGTAGSGHTGGQRVGTSGAPPTSNITLHETFEILSSTGTIQATKTGATSRDWASVITAFHASTIHRQGITPTDYNAVIEKFESSALDFNDAAFRFNDELDRWEVYDVTDIGTLIAHSADVWV